MNTPKNTPNNSNNDHEHPIQPPVDPKPAPIPTNSNQSPASQHSSIQQNNSNQQATQKPYDSNPFTISISGFQLLMKFAQSIVMTILVIGLLSFAFQFFGQVASSFTQDTASAQRDDSAESLDSIRDDAGQELDDSLEESFNLDFNNNSTNIDSEEVIGIVALVAGVVLIIFLVTIPISVAFSAAFKGFIAAGTVAAIHHRNISFGEALSAMASRYGTLFVAEFIALLRIFGGYLLFIVPGIRAQLRYEALPYLIMNDESLGARAAVSHTKELYTKHLMEVFGIKFFASIIPAIGQAFAAGGIGLSMQQLHTYKQANLATPKTHWLNYLGLILGLVLFLFIVAIVAIVITVAVSS